MTAAGSRGEIRSGAAMFTGSRPYTFHIELTDRCNAGCPMCPRTDAMNFCRPDRTVVRNVQLTLEDFRAHFTGPFCARTREVIFGGAYGDPLVARDLLAIADHLTVRGVRVAVSTNGSLRKPGWWRRLGEALRRTGGRLELHVDGLADTNPLYRVNTDFARIMEDACAYIATGARAEWHFIIFRHNQHQIEEAFHLSRRTGFAVFTLIDTVRFSGRSSHPYRMPDGTLRHLEPPEVRASDFALGDTPSDIVTSVAAAGAAPCNAGGVNGIRCKAAAFNRPYISAHGQVSACCWVAGSRSEADLLGCHGLEAARYNIRNRPLEEILRDEPFASLYAAGWREDSLATCRHKCGRMVRNQRKSL